jgi:16S rRNA A1518/A1519 N6-dimethyltransferase RsmA/KsgA/DIM1 with predicted DNA glycosylase/AP lyase activity
MTVPSSFVVIEPNKKEPQLIEKEMQWCFHVTRACNQQNYKKEVQLTKKLSCHKS